MHAPSSTPVPWLLLVGLALSVPPLLRIPPPRRRQAVLTAIGLSALGLVALVVRRQLVPVTYFHQRGQGPIWVLYTSVEGSQYGPGYHELFGFAAALSPLAPDRWVFGAQQAAGALFPALAWLLARLVGAPRVVALSLAVAAAVDPTSARIFGSESYYGTCSFLLLLAAVFLAAGARPARVTSHRFVAAVVAAGLLVSQAARVHPVSWAPASMIPLVVLVAPGAPGRRIMRAAAAFAGVALVVASTSAVDMLQVMSGRMGAEWLPRIAGTVQASGGQSLTSRLLPSAIVALASSLCAALLPRHRGLVLRVGALSFAFALSQGVHLVRDEPPWIAPAYMRLWAPVLAAAFTSLAGSVVGAPGSSPARRRGLSLAVAAAVVGIAVANLVARGRDATMLAVDVREQAWALAWRERIEPSALIYYLGVTPDLVFNLPWFGERVIFGPGPLPDVMLRGSLYYYRSSLCSTAQGREACDAFERAHSLEPIEERRYAAAGAREEWPYLEPVVRVGLYRLQP